MRIAKQELFAPVMLVLSYETREEAVELANITRYALGASVFGSNEKECNWIGKRIKAGMVCTNDFGGKLR